MKRKRMIAMQLQNSWLYRLTRRSIGASILLVAPALVVGQDFPSTLDDYVTVYEINSYRQFQHDSAEYRRRLEFGEKLLQDMKKHGGRSAKAAAKDWFMTASYSGATLPARPAFEYLRDTQGKGSMIAETEAGKDESSRASAAPLDTAVATKSDAISEAPQAEYDWQDVSIDSGENQNEPDIAAAADASGNDVIESFRASIRSLTGASANASTDIATTVDVPEAQEAPEAEVTDLAKVELAEVTTDLAPPTDTPVASEPMGAIASTKKAALDLAALVFGGGSSKANEAQAEPPQSQAVLAESPDASTDDIAEPLAEATPDDAKSFDDWAELDSWMGDDDSDTTTGGKAVAGDSSHSTGDSPQADSTDSRVARVNTMIDDFNASAEELELEWEAALEGDGRQIESLVARLESKLDSRRKLQSEIDAVSTGALRPVMDFGSMMQGVRNGMADFNAKLFDTPQAISFEEGVKLLGRIQNLTGEAVSLPSEG